MDITREWLEQKYLKEQWSCAKIGRVVGRDPKTVWSWLKTFGIPTRSTGNDPASRKGQKNLDVSHKVGRKLPEEVKEKIRQARIRDGRLPCMVDGVHWLHVYGKERHPRWKGGITAGRQAFYQTPEWKKVERFVKKRDGHTCQRCGKVWSKGEPFDIHHIVSFACVELRASVDNLVYLCEPCHYWVHGPENTERSFLK